MRIGIDARMIDNTGIGRYLRNLLIHLAYLDNENEYVVFLNQENTAVVEQENFTVVRLKIHIPLYSLREQYWLPLEIRKRNVDLMHYPNFDLPIFQSCPYIVTIHDLIYYLYPEQCPSKIAHYYARFMIRYATTHARMVLTDSEHSKHDLMSYFKLPADKIHVIYPAADKLFRTRTLERRHPAGNWNAGIPAGIADRMSATQCGQDARAPIQKYGIHSPYIFYIGKHHPYKNIKALLSAYKQYAEIYENFQLVIGGKRDERRQDLYTLVSEFGMEGRILFTDFVPETEIFELYRQAELFVFPSLYEGFGLPPLEAMACGVPVICSNAASLPEVVGDAAIQVNASDVNELADAIRTVLTNTDLREELKLKGQRRALQFSWEHAARQLMQVYERIYHGR